MTMEDRQDLGLVGFQHGQGSLLRPRRRSSCRVLVVLFRDGMVGVFLGALYIGRGPNFDIRRVWR
jgi:hypothetical protein